LADLIQPRTPVAFNRLTREMDTLVAGYSKQWKRQPTRGRPNEKETGRNKLIIHLAELFQNCSAWTDPPKYRTRLTEFLRTALYVHQIWRVPTGSRLLRILKEAEREDLLAPL
jgi:hypothetical protein